MSAHTPGPWAHRNGRIYQADREELTIAHVARALDGDYSLVNGRLIAAAPSLLEALRELYEAEIAIYPNASAGEEAQAAWVMRRSDARDAALAAIAAATGAA